MTSSAFAVHVVVYQRAASAPANDGPGFFVAWAYTTETVFVEGCPPEYFESNHCESRDRNRAISYALAELAAKIGGGR